MVYKPNVPQPSDTFGQSQVDFLTNFQTLDSDFGVDHTAFSADNGTNNGKHKAIHLQTAADPTTGGTEAGLYTKVSGGNQELFYRYQSNGTIFKLTDQGSVAGAAFVAGSASWNGVAWSLTGTQRNVASVAGGSSGPVYTFTTSAPSTDYLVFATPFLPNSVVSLTYTFTAATGTLTITKTSAPSFPSGTVFNVMIILP